MGFPFRRRLRQSSRRTGLLIACGQEVRASTLARLARSSTRARVRAASTSSAASASSWRIAHACTDSSAACRRSSRAIAANVRRQLRRLCTGRLIGRDERAVCFADAAFHDVLSRDRMQRAVTLVAHADSAWTLPTLCGEPRHHPRMTYLVAHRRARSLDERRRRAVRSELAREPSECRDACSLELRHLAQHIRGRDRRRARSISCDREPLGPTSTHAARPWLLERRHLQGASTGQRWRRHVRRRESRPPRRAAGSPAP